MANTRLSRGFTIIELLIVVSIIALLMGILLPAIGKARDQALQTRSQANLRQLVAAHASYSADWSDRQWTLVPHNIGNYANGNGTMISGWASGTGTPLPIIFIGPSSQGGWWWYPQGGSVPLGWYEPIQFQGANAGFGFFRTMNVQSFNEYVDGRFYDEVFYAPKDRAVTSAVGECFEDPGAFCDIAELMGQAVPLYFSSYVLSPAALYNPAVLRYNEDLPQMGFQNPFSLPAGFRTPNYSQSRFPDLKTHMLEHHWLQRMRAECNPLLAPGTYDGCEPYYFNHALDSTPMTAFYDGSIRGLGTREAIAADGRAGGSMSEFGPGGTPRLWHPGTPFGIDGYFSDVGYNPWDPAMGWQPPYTSFHILTSDGIQGRDTVAGLR